MHDLYCPIIPRDPKWNPGKLPCPDYEKDNCRGCIIYQDQMLKRKYEQKKQEMSE